MASVLYDSLMTSPDPFNHKSMPDKALEDYLRLCQEVFRKMQSEGSWPWPDSQNPDDLVESNDP